jgi:hypothetical protein
MIELFISPGGSAICMIDKNENLVDISEDFTDEIFFHKLFSEVLNEDELLVDDEEIEEIFMHIVHKAYLSKEKNAANHKLNDFKYTHEIGGQTKKKIMVAFSRVFKQACQNKLKDIITVEYL